MINGKKRAISWNEIVHYVYTLLYSLQFVVARQLRILKSKKRAVFLNFADISNMREKTPDILDIRDVEEVGCLISCQYPNILIGIKKIVMFS